MSSLEKPSTTTKRPNRRSLSQPVQSAQTSTNTDKPILNLGLYPLQLEECYTDSPMLRKKLNLEEELATDFSNSLKNHTRLLKTIVTTAQAHSQSISLMTTEAILLGRAVSSADVDRLDFEQELQTFASVIQLGENLRINMFKDFDEQASKPFESIIEDIRDAKESGKKWNRLCTQTDSCAAKIVQLKKNSNKLDETEIELQDLRKQQSTASMELSAKLNVVSAKRRLELLDSLCSFIEQQNEFIEQYQALLRDYMPQIRECRSKINIERNYFPKAMEEISEKTIQMSNAPASSSVGITIQGYLFKKTKMNFTRRNYFVLQNGILSCYENLANGEPKMTLDMLICSVKPSPEANRNYCFDIISPYKSYNLQAESQETMNRWIIALQEAISAQLDKQRVSKRGRSMSSNKGTASSVISKEKAASIAAEETKKREETINNFYRADDENKLCADCGDKNPTWVSINLGILICLECSGIHRSMGTHISKVRSLTLDKLSSETQAYLLCIGNKKSNSIFEPSRTEAIPTSLGTRITSHSSRKDRESWIRAKYLEKIFVETYRGRDIQGDLISTIFDRDVVGAMKLYAQGANLNYKYTADDSKQPIHYAAQTGSTEVLEFLIQNGAQVNGKDAHGETALHISAAFSVHCTALLCRHRAKIDITDDKNRTAFDIALESQDADLVTLLRLAKLAREEDAGMDDASFVEALDNFTADVQRRKPEVKPKLSSSLPTSSSLAIAISRKEDDSPENSFQSHSMSPEHSSNNHVLSASPPTTSSFSFSSKLDKKPKHGATEAAVKKK